jgi:hypothetical protein
MADLFQLESGLTESSSPSGISPASSSLSTGDLRRKYNFGDRVSELAIASDPFFRFVSKIAKKPTDDPEFKFTERRGSYHKRYAYVVGFYNGSADTFNSAELVTSGGSALTTAAGQEVKLFMATDYKSAGNVGTIFGQSGNDILVGDDGTQPSFFLPDQMVKVNMTSNDTGGHDGGAAVTSVNQNDYIIVKINTVHSNTSTGSVQGRDLDDGAVAGSTKTYYYTPITGTIVRPLDAAANKELCSFVADDPIDAVYSASVSNVLEPMRSYVVGTAHAQGSGYPETWKDQPFSTGYGRTQIWKTAMAMDNTTRATVLKYEANEWARVWKEKLVEHKWDIEQSLLFGSQYDSGSEWYTQGAVDYISSYGNVFSLTIATKTQDDFLDDLSNYLDPRYNNANATLFFCDTATYNWLHKLSGYFANNLEISPNFRADMSLTAKKKAFGVDISTINTPYGDMNVARNIHLDGHPIKILAVNMRYCKYRPLVGNGLNRDTAVYVGVQTLENSGVDRRVDLIQTEAGMEWQMPEAHAYWS